MKPLLRFLVYSNLFIAAVAILMVKQTYFIFIGGVADTNLLNFVFFSTICSYNFHYFLTDHSVLPSPRVDWIKKYKSIILFLFLAGFAGAAWYGWELINFWPWLLPAVAATFLYSAPKIPHVMFRLLRKVAIGKTIFLSFIWMYVTTVLPLVISGQEWQPSHTIFCIEQFFYIYMICILFDYRDREDDKAEGVRSLITFLSEKNIKRLFYFSFVITLLTCLAMLYYGLPGWQVLIIFFPAVLLAFLYNKAITDFSDLFYYFFLDGLMALSAVLTWLAHI